MALLKHAVNAFLGRLDYVDNFKKWHNNFYSWSGLSTAMTFLCKVTWWSSSMAQQKHSVNASLSLLDYVDNPMTVASVSIPCMVSA